MPCREFILTEAVILSESEGGRNSPLLPVAYGGKYRPHIVIEDRSNRIAKMGIIEGRRQCIDRYLGVAFWAGPDQIPVGQPILLTLLLMYGPSDIYREVIDGAPFTLREGGKIVGHGIVKKRWQEGVV